MRNKLFDRLQQVCFPDAVGFESVSKKLDTDLLNNARGTYKTRLEKCSSAWPAGSVNAGSPHPVLITQRHHEELQELHRALNLAIEDIIERWWTDEQAQFPQRMPLEPQEEDLLRVNHPIHFILFVHCYLTIVTDDLSLQSGYTQIHAFFDPGMRDKVLGDRIS